MGTDHRELVPILNIWAPGSFFFIETNLYTLSMFSSVKIVNKKKKILEKNGTSTVLIQNPL